MLTGNRQIRPKESKSRGVSTVAILKKDEERLWSTVTIVFTLSHQDIAWLFLGATSWLLFVQPQPSPAQPSPRHGQELTLARHMKHNCDPAKK